MKLSALHGGNVGGPSAQRSVFPWCGRARLRVGPGAPPMTPTGATGRRRPRSPLVRVRVGEVPTPAAMLWREAMDVIYERVAGLDVHKRMVVACVRRMSGNQVSRECRSFATTTAGLLGLLAWLSESGCTHVAMEATGVYWKPVWNILSDGGFVLMVANASHIKNVPGRKTDLNDAMWIADLLACGLIKASFVPPQDLQELRALLRTRKQLVREQTSHVQRIQKTLEEANIKLDTVISDVLGVNGRRMIQAIVAGVRDPRQLAALADRRLKATPKQLYDALHGRVRDHHRFLLQLHLAQWDALEAAIRAVDREADARIAELDDEEDAAQAPFCEVIARLSMMPGVSVLAARTIVAKIGRD